MKRLGLYLTVLALLISLAGCGGGEDDGSGPKHISEIYPPPWVYEESSKIQEALLSNNVENCSAYKYRASVKHGGDRFVLYCENEEGLWDMYWVREGGAVVGPEKPSRFLEMTRSEVLEEDVYVGSGEVGVVGRWVDSVGPAVVAIQMTHDGRYIFHRKNSDGSEGSYSLRKDKENTFHRDDSFGHKYRVVGKRLFLLDEKGIIRVINEHK